MNSSKLFLLFLSTLITQLNSERVENDFINCTCGEFTPTKRYIDGVAITDAEYPWMVGILKGNGPVGKPSCFGALISDRHILTAASCVKSFKRYQLSVYFYGKNVTRRRRRSVQDISVHEDYSKTNHDNNLAIITLAVPLDLEKIPKEEISPICVINPFLFKGRLEKMKGIMAKMQYFKTVLVGSPKYYFGSVPVKIHGIRNPICSNIFTERVKGQKTLCADLDGHCYGSEGSPLSVTLSQTGQVPVSTGGKYYLLGVYSKGYGCDGYQTGKSGVDVSTNLLRHIDWLVRKTRDGYFCPSFLYK